VPRTRTFLSHLGWQDAALTTPEISDDKGQNS
jgi:hypothetical protein